MGSNWLRRYEPTTNLKQMTNIVAYWMGLVGNKIVIVISFPSERKATVQASFCLIK
jgi:hypothetical protein